MKIFLGRNEVAGESCSYCWLRRTPQGRDRTLGAAHPEMHVGQAPSTLCSHVFFKGFLIPEGRCGRPGASGNPGGLVESPMLQLRSGLGRILREEKESSPMGNWTGKGMLCFRNGFQALNEITMVPSPSGPWTHSSGEGRLLVRCFLTFLSSLLPQC